MSSLFRIEEQTPAPPDFELTSTVDSSPFLSSSPLWASSPRQLGLSSDSRSLWLNFVSLSTNASSKRREQEPDRGSTRQTS